MPLIELAAGPPTWLAWRIVETVLGKVLVGSASMTSSCQVLDRLATVTRNPICIGGELCQLVRCQFVEPDEDIVAYTGCILHPLESKARDRWSIAVSKA